MSSNRRMTTWGRSGFALSGHFGPIGALTAGRTVASRGEGRDNNFNLLRMVAAISVLVSHSYPIALGAHAREPLESLLGMSLGTLAVMSFFAISGYFIAQSCDRSDGAISFIVARVLRLYPALVVALILTVVVLGPVFTVLPLRSYFLSGKTLSYVPLNLKLWPLQYDLPGVFTGNTYGPEINGSLWSLAYEVFCYAMVLFLGVVKRRSSVECFIPFVICYAALYIMSAPWLAASHSAASNLRLLSFPFVLGMGIYRFRDHISLSFGIAVVLGACAFAARGSAWFHEIFVAAWTYGLFYVGFLPQSSWLRYSRVGDYSYGTYIYAFPAQQSTAVLFRGCLPHTLMVLSLPFTLALAFCSWHFVEERALSQRRPALLWIQRYLRWR